MVACDYHLDGFCLCPEKQRPGYLAVRCDRCIERGAAGNPVAVTDAFLISIRA